MRALAMLVAAATLAVGCNSKTDTAPGASASAAMTAPAVKPEAAAVPAPAVTQASWAPETLDELVAPIALYPDALLGQILAAAVNPQEVMDGGNWLLQNQNLTGDALDSAATQAGFGPAMRALFQFPTVVDMLCQQIDWTRQVGSAFTSDQKAVLDAVQRLRTQAAAAGNLKSTPEQTVEKKSEGDKVIVEVKPADPKVVYVPQYDPQAVYAPAPAQPAPAATTTPATTESTVSTSSAVAGGILAFGVGVILGKALEDDDDYCYPNWGAGGVYYGSRPFYPPAYVYRPAYGPGMHPSYRYTSPPGYRHAYNNVNVNRNVVVNNNNYFNRFANNQNLRVNPQQRNVSRAGNETWKGQSTYAGTRDARPSERSNAAAARGGSNEQRSRAESVDRGYGGSTRNGTTRGTSEPRGDVTRSDARESRDVATSRDTNRAPDRHTAPADVAARERTASTSAVARENALAGASRQESASFDRAASARGSASAGGRELGESRHR